MELSAQFKDSAWHVKSCASPPDSPTTLSLPDVNPHHISELQVTLTNCWYVPAVEAIPLVASIKQLVCKNYWMPLSLINILQCSSK